MCAIIGAVLLSPTPSDFVMLERVFHESKIRGMHATGLAYVKDDRIHIERKPVPADQFEYKWEDYLNENGNLYLIGHCRYSTSDLEFNQPLGNADKAIVHNGVITQELPENWEEIYNYKCYTKNDSELVLHSLDPLDEFSHMSMGVCELYADRKLRFYRNGKRPLYLSAIQNGCIITSTADIAKRAEVSDVAVESLMNVYTTFDQEANMFIERKEIKDAVDYQHEIR
jgi:glutamine phosphoribosylpyrophosphate amidotransferase